MDRQVKDLYILLLKHNWQAAEIANHIPFGTSVGDAIRIIHV